MGRAPRVTLEVRRAGPDDLGAAIDILEEASSWVASLGMDGWVPGSFRSPKGRGYRIVRENLAAGELYLAHRDGGPVATVTLQSTDPLYWPDAPQDALYVHRLAVRRDAAGSGVGRALLRWSEEQAIARGRVFLRLDCPSGNPDIRAFYRSAGFEHRGDLAVDAFPLSLLEKPCGRSLADGPSNR
jgi:GNAT superfamily N-acetyltransferase